MDDTIRFYKELEKIIISMVPSDVNMKKLLELPTCIEITELDTDKTILFIIGVAVKSDLKLALWLFDDISKDNEHFNSLVVFRNVDNITKKDLALLMNKGGEMVCSLDAIDDIERKFRKYFTY